MDEAFAHWRRGDKALANVRLAFARIPRLDDRSDAYRLFLAEELLDAGMSPAALMKGLGFDAPRAASPSMIRTSRAFRPATAETAEDGARAAARASARADDEHPRSRRRGHSRRERAGSSGGRPVRFGGRQRVSLASKHWRRRVGPAVLLGAIFVPTPAGVVSQGAIPGEPGLSYSFDEPAGLLRLYRDDEAGQQTVAEARLRPDGILAETNTGLPIARMVKGSLVFDAESLAESTGRSRRAERARRTEALSRSRPRRAAWGVGARHRLSGANQRLNNPQRPLPAGMPSAWRIR